MGYQTIGWTDYNRDESLHIELFNSSLVLKHTPGSGTKVIIHTLCMITSNTGSFNTTKSLLTPCRCSTKLKLPLILLSLTRYFMLQPRCGLVTNQAPLVKTSEILRSNRCLCYFVWCVLYSSQSRLVTLQPPDRSVTLPQTLSSRCLCLRGCICLPYLNNNRGFS